MGRGHVELVHAHEIPLEPFEPDGWPAAAQIKVLSSDPDSGALTGIVELPAGYRRRAGFHACASEVFILEGSLRTGDVAHDFGHYEFSPAGTRQASWATSGGCRILFLARARPEFVVGSGSSDSSQTIRVDTEAMQWRQSKVPGPPPGILSKTLRHSEETGERVFLCTCVHRYSYPLIEYHDCVEEAFQIAGHMWIGTSGMMGPGSYFWRPPYVTHGPFYSPDGMLTLFTTDGPLVNHYVDDPGRTAEENRAEAESQGPPTDYFAGFAPERN
jgi:hypothetical protein